LLSRKYLTSAWGLFTFLTEKENLAPAASDLQRDAAVAAAAAEVTAEVAAAAVEGTLAVAWAAAAEGTLADAWAAAVRFMAAAAEVTLAVAVVAGVQPIMGAEVAAAAAVAWGCGSEAAGGAVEATEPAGNGTRSCLTGSTSASNSRDL
jgi:hypothetical protein